MSRSGRVIGPALCLVGAVLVLSSVGRAAPPDKEVVMATAVGRPASDLVMLVDAGEISVPTGLPGLHYFGFSRVLSDGTTEAAPFVVPPGKVLVITSASGSLGAGGPADGIATVTLYNWATPGGPVLGVYGNNFHLDGAGFADVKINFGSGITFAPGRTVLLTSPIVSFGLNLQGYLAPQ